MKTRPGILRLLLALALGALIFATGVFLARRWLPEWQADRLAPQTFFAQRFQEMARTAGIQLDPGAPHAAFAKRDESLDLDDSVQNGLPPGKAADLGAGLLVDVRRRGRWVDGHDRPREVVVRFSATGHPMLFQFGSKQEIVTSSMRREVAPAPESMVRLASLLLRPGESLGSLGRGGGQGSIGTTFPIQGSQPAQQILSTALPGGALLLIRQLVEPAKKKSTLYTVLEILFRVVPLLAGCLTAIVLFFVLLGRRRIDLVAGMWLGVLLLASSAVALLTDNPAWMTLLSVLGALFLAFWSFLTWSTGESYLRSAQPGLTVSLDALFHGRLGPRGG